MKKITGFIIFFFLTSSLIGQDIELICSFTPKLEYERIENIQILPEAIYCLNAHTSGGVYKQTFDHFILYKFENKNSKVTVQVLDMPMEKDEGLQFVSFFNNTWYYLTEKVVNSYTFEYALLSINTEGEVDKKIFKTIELPKSSKKHVDKDRPGLIGHGDWIVPFGSVRFAENKKSFLVSIRISHTSLLAFVFNNDGTLKFEKEIYFVNKGEEVKTSEVPDIEAALMDDYDNLYFVLSKFGKKYSRYCSVMDDQVTSTIEPHTKKRINSALYSNDGQISAITLSNNIKDVTVLTNTFDEHKIKVDNKYNYDFGDYIILSKESIAKKNKQVFLSTSTKRKGNYQFLADLVVFSVSNNGIEDFVSINRLLPGSTQTDMNAQFWTFEDDYYVLYNSYTKRPQGSMDLFSTNSSMYLTKLDAQLNEIKTNELSFISV